MQTQPLHQNPFTLPPCSGSLAITMPTSNKKNDRISELVYNGQQTRVPQLLVSLLQQLGQQSRWLLWLIPQQKLSKSWLRQIQLPVDKVVQLNQMTSLSTVDVMEKALLTGNYSIVLGWLPKLTEYDRLRLNRAAELGNAYGVIMHHGVTLN